MLKKSFRLKVAVAFLIGILGCMLAMSLMCELLLRPLFINDSKQSMQDYGRKVARALNRGSDTIAELLQSINDEYLIKITVLDEDMQVCYAGYGDSSNPQAKNVRSAQKWVAGYLEEHEEGTPYFKELYNEEDRIRRVIHVRKSKSGYYIVLNKPIKGIEQNVQLVSRFILITGISMAFVITVLWSILTRPFVSQMEKMSRVTRKMSQLDFEEKVGYRSSDEIGVLAESINDMSDSLKESIETLQENLERRKILIRNISHELKTPITTIRGYAEHTQAMLPEHEKVSRYCDIMIEECDSIDRLVGSMLEMSRLESGETVYEMQQVNTKGLAEQLMKRVAVELPQAGVAADCEDGLLYANPYLLECALFNYLDNAVKYGKPGADIRLTGRREEERYVYTVINEGTPISEEEMEDIWDVFYKTDKSRKRNNGYGIGLSIVRQAAKLHGGGVDVSCENGKTAFSLWIPMDR